MEIKELNLIDWLVDNYEVLFGGLGTAIVVGIAGFVFNKQNSDKKENNSQKIKSGKTSTNFQAQGDINISLDTSSVNIDGKKKVDIKLFEELKQVIPSNGSIQFIDEHNMAGFSFQLSKLDDIHNFYYEWSNPEHMFLDEELETKKMILHEYIGEYIDLISENTFPTKTSGWQTVPPEWEVNDKEYFQKVVKSLHDLAGLIVKAHQDLFKTARSSLQC